MSDQTAGASPRGHRQAPRGPGPAFALPLVAFLAAALPSLAQPPVATPSDERQERLPSAARPTPNADNESDDADRRPGNRKTVTQTFPGGRTVEVAFGVPKTGGREYAEMESLAPGKVVRFFDAAAIKLTTELDLLFGETRVRAANVAPSYPGVYSLWLERTGEGWRLVFNEKADVWGTQRDPAADVAQVPLHHEKVDGLTLAFDVELRGAPASDGSVVLTFQWGEHRWTTSFHAAR